MKNIPVYNPAMVEGKWQRHWEENHSFAAEKSHEKPKFYPLIEFPYPSGAGLHVGHPRSNTAMDIIARKRRMEGYNVLFPIGYDSFGLPAERYAIKNHVHPAIVTKQTSTISCSASASRLITIARSPRPTRNTTNGRSGSS